MTLLRSWPQMSSDGQRIWSNHFDREGDDPFALQDELAATLASKAALEIDAHEKALAKLRQGARPAATKHVEEARELFPLLSLAAVEGLFGQSRVWPA